MPRQRQDKTHRQNYINTISFRVMIPYRVSPIAKAVLKRCIEVWILLNVTSLRRSWTIKSALELKCIGSLRSIHLRVALFFSPTKKQEPRETHLASILRSFV